MAEPWLERWQEGRIGWHEPAGNRNLQEHWAATSRHVLVPLCGKTPDLLWLEEQGNAVVGVELSAVAARDFFLDNQLAFSIDDAQAATRYVAVDRKISIVCGDYFEFSDAPFDAIYDRAALIALPRDQRPAYAAHTRSLLTANAYQMLVSLEYDQSLVKGPPYAVFADEVRTYWPQLQRVGETEDIQNAPPKFRQAGVKRMREIVWVSG
ncbi:MAG: thiopurine S-methyltransferase [Gammaproteobacteria bacterium]|nr:thiopurine S-methyltransferase [Gammaproteobacteria bacterium]